MIAAIEKARKAARYAQRSTDSQISSLASVVLVVLDRCITNPEQAPQLVQDASEAMAVLGRHRIDRRYIEGEKGYAKLKDALFEVWMLTTGPALSNGWKLRQQDSGAYSLRIVVGGAR